MAAICGEAADMTHEYKGEGPYDSPFQPEQCKACIATPALMNSYQCSRKPWKDGWCKQHHPDTEAKRRAERSLRWRLKQEHSLDFLLGKAREEIVRLKARIAELEEQT